MRRTPPLLTLVLALSLVAAACGSDDPGSAAGGAPETPGDLSGITMVDVASGQEVALTEALDAPPSTPVLAAFWAPH